MIPCPPPPARPVFPQFPAPLKLHLPHTPASLDCHRAIPLTSWVSTPETTWTDPLISIFLIIAALPYDEVSELNRDLTLDFTASPVTSGSLTGLWTARSGERSATSIRAEGRSVCGSGEWVCLGGVREVGAHLWREGLPVKSGRGRVFPTMILDSPIRSACAGITLGAVTFSAAVASTQPVTLTRRTSGEGGWVRRIGGQPLRADRSFIADSSPQSSGVLAPGRARRRRPGGRCG